MQQKLVTVYLDTASYEGSEWLKPGRCEAHGLVEEHLQQYLEEGWQIASMQGVGGAAYTDARGWLAVLLERE
ncbi:hypothetical protein Mal4_48970 [Maioricimonas rarisocia]|uniref:DUF4177 domain-containing protein n=1 Tax=Maioricimonas rarisocia TaxID=2528026 RepID=A0A517ZDJ4_9PLAN|nr:hypothetical protein [Maioricimonas rarisocia]QDU40539.1 hypothetical protein Mal4_48970 [Maioricimonas rarisocia]